MGAAGREDVEIKASHGKLTVITRNVACVGKASNVVVNCFSSSAEACRERSVRVRALLCMCFMTELRTDTHMHQLSALVIPQCTCALNVNVMMVKDFLKNTFKQKKKKPIIQEKINQVTRPVEVPQTQYVDFLVDGSALLQRYVPQIYRTPRELACSGRFVSTVEGEKPEIV